ncbi:hypothetical protein H8L32_21620 [Undibacterium sp. CY18W]|uniref:Uncharacterized protein n=1 Tax=Undibacterium hunanense TaxID=2762292 RepID=A0ABR6ZW21_9BURK|nr:hypothetical protein [Undibacterium hunanense]MBC3920081.1 hypothetical protein [Undibacterium hunanense]
MTILSTTSDNDLSLANSELVQFVKNLPGIPEEKYLQFKNKWFLASKAGCSCDFRHLLAESVELGFGEPEEWFHEEKDSIEATRQISAQIRSLLQQNGAVDCVDTWAHGQVDAAELVGDLKVNFAEIKDSAFRFFENHRFCFTLP